MNYDNWRMVMCLKPKRDPAVDEQLRIQRAQAAEQEQRVQSQISEQKQQDVSDLMQRVSRRRTGRRSLLSSSLGGIGFYSRF